MWAGQSQKREEDVMEEERWEAERKHKAALAKEQNRLEWYEYHRRLEEHHARLSEEHRAKADALIPPEPGS